jgi:hypothetical protein
MQKWFCDVFRSMPKMPTNKHMEWNILLNQYNVSV